MAKQPRKVALINVHDYNRDNYSAYYEIRVGTDENDPGAGYMWGVRIYARQEFVSEPVLGESGQPEMQDVADPNDPKGGPLVIDGKRIQVPKIRRSCKVLEEVVDVAPDRDSADTAAQTWVKTHMEKYRRPSKPENKEAGYALAGGPAWMMAEIAIESLDLVRRFFEWLSRPLLMALGYSATLRNNRMAEITALIDGGAGAGLWRIYDGVRPATCGTATTLLAELTLSDPSAGAPSGGVLTFNAITPDASANATGTATWARIVDSTGTCVIDMNVGTSGSDLNLNSTSISAGQEVSITSATITEGNA